MRTARMPVLLLLLVVAQSDARLTFLSRQLGQAKDPRARAQAALLLATDWRRVNRLYGPMTIAEEVETEAGAILARGPVEEFKA